MAWHPVCPPASRRGPLFSRWRLGAVSRRRVGRRRKQRGRLLHGGLARHTERARQGRVGTRGEALTQSIIHVALVVRDYDEAIAFYVGTLGFTLVEDTYQPEQDKRWVVVAPPGSSGTTLLLARASTPEQEPFAG